MREGWAGHVACVEEKRNTYRFWVGNLKERGDLECIGIEGSIILKRILKTGLEDLDWIDLA